MLNILFYIKRLPRGIFSRYYIIISQDSSLLDASYRLRYEVYCLEKQYLDKNLYPDGRETDIYDQYSVHIFALDKYNKIVGMTRLINSYLNTLQIENDFDIKDRLLKLSKARIVEVLRLIVRKDYRKTFLFIDLLRAILIYSRENKIDYL